MSFVPVSENTVNSAERRTARALALQALYELDCTDHPVEQVLPARLKQADPDPDPNLDLVDSASEPAVKGKAGKHDVENNDPVGAAADPDSDSENRISANQRTFIYAIVNGVRGRRASIDLILQRCEQMMVKNFAPCCNPCGHIGNSLRSKSEMVNFQKQFMPLMAMLLLAARPRPMAAKHGSRN